jgi:uncharacterized protein (TIGR03435 family)
MRTRLFVALSLFLGIFGAGLRFQGLGAQTSAAQAPALRWEIDAGGKMAFDVTSVKLDTSGKPTPPNFALDNGDDYPGNTTLFSADFPLTTYIGFAYKLPPSERQALESQLPKWATTERFDIEARATAPSTKNQMRLMMQSLLADRFKLTIHLETQEKPVFALVLLKAGKTGAQLRPYADDPSCGPTPHLGQVAPGLMLTVGNFPPMCYILMGFRRYANGANLITWGSRNVSMEQIAEDMETAPTADIDRPVVDGTGLGGNFDFVMNFGQPTPVPPGSAEPQDSGPSFLEALKDQLGLKLDSTTAAVENPVIDHIEEPSAN